MRLPLDLAVLLVCVPVHYRRRNLYLERPCDPVSQPIAEDLLTLRWLDQNLRGISA